MHLLWISCALTLRLSKEETVIDAAEYYKKFLLGCEEQQGAEISDEQGLSNHLLMHRCE